MLEVVTSPITLIPVMIGTTIIFGMLAFNSFGIILSLVSLMLIFLGVSVGYGRFFYSDEIKQKVSKALEDENILRKQEEIENLRNILSKDCLGLLDDIIGLRITIKTFMQESKDSSSSSDLLGSCYDLLERSFDNLKTIAAIQKNGKVSGENTKKILSSKIKSLSLEVKENIECVSSTLMDMQNKSHSQTSKDNARLDIMNRIETAKLVDLQVSQLLQTLSVGNSHVAS